MCKYIIFKSIITHAHQQVIFSYEVLLYICYSKFVKLVILYTGHFSNFVKSLKISGILQNFWNFN